MTALVVDHDEQIRKMAVRLLRGQGIESAVASSLAAAQEMVAAAHYDLVLVHLHLADGPGTDLTAELGRSHPDTATIVVSGSTASGTAGEALASGVDDYLPQPFTAEELSVSVTRALRRRLERSSATQARESHGNELHAAHSRLAEEVLDCLTRAGRFRDEETAEHVERVSRSCALIGLELGLSTEECAELRAASAMHDIGKIGVPDGVLGKPGKLNVEERDMIERHAEIGHRILSGSTDPVLHLAASIARTHHERIDGKGYPMGLSGDEIPLVGRITAVADVFDALTHSRVYRPALTLEAALDILDQGDGTQFDTRVLAALQAVLSQVLQISELYPDSGLLAGDPSQQETEDSALRVLVVDDHAAVARGLALLLRRAGMEIAGMAQTLVEAQRLIAHRDADVVVLDRNLQGDDGLQLIPPAHARGARVLLYTGGGSQAAGPADEEPDGIASKAGGPAELLAAIRDVAAGRASSDSRVQMSGPAPGEAMLTPREREIVSLIAMGHTGEDIGVQLFLSHHTVRTHIRNAMERAQARTRPHLIAIALQAGEITFARPAQTADGALA